MHELVCYRVKIRQTAAQLSRLLCCKKQETFWQKWSFYFWHPHWNTAKTNTFGLQLFLL